MILFHVKVQRCKNTLQEQETKSEALVSTHIARSPEVVANFVFVPVDNNSSGCQSNEIFHRAFTLQMSKEACSRDSQSETQSSQKKVGGWVGGRQGLQQRVLLNQVATIFSGRRVCNKGAF